MIDHGIVDRTTPDLIAPWMIVSYSVADMMSGIARRAPRAQAGVKHCIRRRLKIFLQLTR